MIRLNCQNIQREYGEQHFTLEASLADPIEQFIVWYKEIAATHPEPNAMVLSTVDQQLQPDSRVVLLKEINDHGFVFYSHNNSAKGLQLAEHPYAALNFYWSLLARQVRIRGPVVTLPHEQAATYFATRPRLSQLVATALTESQITTAAEMEAALLEAEQRYLHSAIPCPSTWTGYIVEPETIEFFQGRNGRAHDRIVYKLAGDQWEKFQLYP